MRLRVVDLPGAAGRELGPSAWVSLDQAQVDAFAAATGDDQWIHVDPVRAAAGPFGRTVAHGYLTLALLPPLLGEILELADRRLAINYGIERIRFTAPVPVGSRVRLRATLAEVQPRGDGLLLRLAVVLELEGSEQPALVGETLSLVFAEA